MITYNISTEYASQSPELNGIIPLCSYIDKSICGCGLTTMAIENTRNTIIAMPTINLINNKSSQYPNERFSHKVFGLIGGISKTDIDIYINTCLKLKRPIKILTTYDSFYKLEKYFNLCDIIIDESNRLLSSAHLKVSNKVSSKTTDIISELFRLTEKYKDRVSFISATPIPLKYMPEWMVDLTQIKLNWNNTIKVRPILFERTYPYKALIEELILPIKQKGFININGIIVKKLIIFLNSVTDIMNVLKTADVNFEDVRLLVADNDINSNKMKQYKRLSFKDNQESKTLTTYTFATSCAFDGIDLYDEEAINVVVSNVNKHFTMIDIATDLKQAVSRQRVKTNIHYNKYIYIYNKIIFEKSEQVLIDKIEKLKDNLNQSIQLYEIAKLQNLKDGFMVDSDFIAYTNYIISEDTYVINNNLFNADKYAILEIRRQYLNGFDIKKSFNDDCEYIEEAIIPKDITYNILVDYFKKNKNNKKFSWGVYSTKTEWIEIIEKCDKYYNKVWNDITRAQKMINDYKPISTNLLKDINNTFKIGSYYNNTITKKLLQEIYDKHTIKKVAKATDIKKYFSVVITKQNLNNVIKILKSLYNI